MYKVYPPRFSREINPALTGSPEKMPGWQDAALERLGEKCEYLIEVRGFDAWSLWGVRSASPVADEIVARNELCFWPLGSLPGQAGGSCW